MKLDEKILQAIKQGLPEATVGAFKERMDELEHLASQVPDLKEKLLTLGSSFDILKKERDTLNSYKNRLDQIERGENSIKEKTLELKLREEVLAVKTELMTTRVEDHKEMFRVVFKNPTLRTEIFSNKSKNDLQDYNKGSNENSNTTITKSED